MWHVMKGGTWVPADDNQVIAWIREGSIDGATPIRHAAWPGPQALGSVRGFAHYVRTSGKRGMGIGVKILIGVGVLAVAGFIVAVTLGARKAKPEEAEDTETSSSSAGPAGIASKTPTGRCGSVGKWTSCVTAVEREGKHLHVGISIEHSSKTSEETYVLDYDIEDAEGNRYSVDDGAQIDAELAGDTDVCGAFSDQIHPKEKKTCKLLFRIPADLPGALLVLRVGFTSADEVRMSLE